VLRKNARGTLQRPRLGRTQGLTPGRNDADQIPLIAKKRPRTVLSPSNLLRAGEKLRPFARSEIGKEGGRKTKKKMPIAWGQRRQRGKASGNEGVKEAGKQKRTEEGLGNDEVNAKRPK